MIIDGKTNPKNDAKISKQISTQITAQQLHREFVRLGAMRHKLKNRLLAILPEIYKSGIWKKYAGTIEEYAGKFGDIAKTTVKKRLRMEDNLEDKPFLKAAIEKVGVHKVALVAKIATPETDKAFAENILNMSKMAVQSLSKELRAERVGVGTGSGIGGRDERLPASDVLDPASRQIDTDNCDFHQNQKQFCRAVPITKKIELDEESTFLFMKLKTKLGKNLTDKEFLKLILKKMERQEFAEKQSWTVAKRKEPATEAIIITTEKPNLAEGKTIAVANEIVATPNRLNPDESMNKCNRDMTLKPKNLLVEIGENKSVTGDTFRQEAKPATAGSCPRPGRDFITSIPNTFSARVVTSRYIPINKKRQTIALTNGKCAYPNCNLPFQILHHTDRYSESKNHDFIIPLCKIHHEFAHNNLIQNENSAAEKWQLSITKPPTAQIAQAEILYKRYRQKLIA